MHQKEQWKLVLLDRPRAWEKPRQLSGFWQGVIMACAVFALAWFAAHFV